MEGKKSTQSDTAKAGTRGDTFGMDEHGPTAEEGWTDAHNVARLRISDPLPMDNYHGMKVCRLDLFTTAFVVGDDRLHVEEENLYWVFERIASCQDYSWNITSLTHAPANRVMLNVAIDVTEAFYDDRSRVEEESE